MKAFRELMALSKNSHAGALADHFQRPRAAFFMKASRLGLSIKRAAKAK